MKLFGIDNDNIEYVKNSSQLLSHIGEKLPIAVIHPGCGWCQKTVVESFDPICRGLKEKGQKCYLINGTSEEGEMVLNDLNTEVHGFPNTKLCDVKLDDEKQPYLDCTQIKGWKERSFFEDAFKKFGL